MIEYSQNNLIYAQKTHSASLYATYMRTENKASTRKTLHLYCVLLSIFNSIKLVPLALMFVTYHH